MNWKATAAMVAVAAGLGAYVYFVEAPKPAPVDSGEVTVWRHDGDSAKALRRFSLTTPGGEAVFQKSEASGSVEGSWKLSTQPDRDLETWQFETPLNDALTLKAERLVEEKVSDAAAYGFDKPELTLALGTESEPRKAEVVIGAKSPLGSAYYAKGPDEKVYLLSSYKVEAWTRLVSSPPLASPAPSPSPTAAASGSAK